MNGWADTDQLRLFEALFTDPLTLAMSDRFRRRVHECLRLCAGHADLTKCEAVESDQLFALRGAVNSAHSAHETVELLTKEVATLREQLSAAQDKVSFYDLAHEHVCNRRTPVMLTPYGQHDEWMLIHVSPYLLSPDTAAVIAKYKHDTEALSADNDRLREQIAAREAELAAVAVKEGPLNAESWRLDALIAQLEKWKRVASGQTCVSFENLCFGASSLWHQTHRQNFRAIDRKPDELSRWILKRENCLKSDFPSQVLEVLTRMDAELTAAMARQEGGAS